MQDFGESLLGTETLIQRISFWLFSVDCPDVIDRGLETQTARISVSQVSDQWI